MSHLITKSNESLPAALRILARDIECEDGVATAVIAEAADEIERLTDAVRDAGGRAVHYANRAGYLQGAMELIAQGTVADDLQVAARRALEGVGPDLAEPKRRRSIETSRGSTQRTAAKPRKVSKTLKK